MDEKKKYGLPSKFRATTSLISGWFSTCGKGVETSTTSTLISDLNGQKGLRKTTEIDLCFVLDCTSSMETHIVAAKDCIQKVVDHMKRTNPCIKLWVGFCGYRDHCDGTNRIQIFNFTDSYSDFRSYLSDKVQATGGGDIPEDVLGGLDAAVNQMNWCHKTRVLLHMGDSPPHGKHFTDEDDDYPDGDPNGLTAENVFKGIQSAEIHYYFGKITDLTNEMLRVFRGIIGEFVVFDVATEGKDPKALTAKVFKFICSSITTSVTLTSTMEENRKQKILEKDLREPDWSTLTVQAGKLLHYHLPKTLDDIKDPKYFKDNNLVSKNFSYKQAPNPFSAGAERYAYFALDVTNVPVEKTVMKAYIDNGRKANSVERYLEKVEVSTIAYFLSIQFNLVAEQVGIDKKVNFLKVQLLHHTVNSGNRYYTVEPKFQDAEFKRFNVNSGVIKEYHSTLEAFAHFTYEHTGGYLVVYDLQGVELTDQFLLTDPAVHCTDRSRFGRTNLGSKGIDKCLLSNHKCGNICQKLGLAEI